MKANVYGYVDGMLGFNRHTRGLIDGMTENNIDVSLVPLDNRIPQKPSRTIEDSLMREYDFDSPSICISSPTDFNRFYGSKRIGYTTWETSRLPQMWADIINEMDEIWTVGEFSKKVFEDSGVEGDVKLVPEGVDTSVFNPYVDKLAVGGDIFLFYSTFEWERRKGPDVLLKAYSEEFGEGDNVGLVLETYNPLLQRFNPFEAIFKMNLGRLPLIEVLRPSGNEFELAKRLVSADCFVLPSRGESWALSAMEAMACGVPTITTNWGGHLEYAGTDYGWLIDVDGMETPVDEPFLKPYEGNEWANPSVKHLRELMRYAYEHKDECVKKGHAAYEHVDENYNWKKSTSVIKDLLGDA
jgi:glycosyltransferase involved in cell wall biosynthesis